MSSSELESLISNEVNNINHDYQHSTRQQEFKVMYQTKFA